MSLVFQPIQLANGQTLPNRLVKASMEENLGDSKQRPSKALIELYRRWGNANLGLIITGNVMIDRLAMTGPGGIALESERDIQPFAQLATVAKQNGSKIWMQINHPGRQVYAAMGGKVYAPSAVAVDLGKHSHLFGQPIAMTPEHIEDVILRFANTARLAEQAGFDGVEIHAAHGYLLSQFLSPLVNKRDDQYGGSLENRARLLFDIIEAIDSNTTDSFSIAIKLNSADFQRGGFAIDDAKTLVSMLDPTVISCVEISGGSYEAPAMQGQARDGSTLAREAYFLEFAKRIKAASPVPVMVTGGIKRLAIADEVVKEGIELVGMASALAVEPELAKRWLTEPDFVPTMPEINVANKVIASLATMATIRRYLRRVGNKKTSNKPLSAIFSLVLDRLRLARLTKRYRKNVTSMTQVNQPS